MALGDIYRLAMRWQHVTSGDDVVNVWHFQQNSLLILDTPAEDLLQAFTEEVITLYSGLTSPLYLLDLITVRQITGGIEIFEIGASTLGERGTTATGLPGQVACVVSWRTGLAGRRRRGRTYMPPAAEEDLNAGRWIAGYVAGVTNFGNGMVTGMATATIGHASWLFGVWSVPQTVPPPDPPTLFTPITSFIIDPVPGTMRSRRVGSGS